MRALTCGDVERTYTQHFLHDPPPRYTDTQIQSTHAYPYIHNPAHTHKYTPAYTHTGLYTHRLTHAPQGMKNDYGGHDNWHYNNTYAYVGQVRGGGGTAHNIDDMV
jgi:hypothetical protein